MVGFGISGSLESLRISADLNSSRARHAVQCATHFQPCIDIHKGKVKQIVGSTLRDSSENGNFSLVTNFESDKSAAYYGNMYKRDSLTGGHVIMLGADPLSQVAALEALHAFPDRWQKFSDVFVDAQSLEFLASYADEFLVHGVDVDGKRLGIDGELVTLLGSLSPIPVTYAGGVSKMEDLERIKIAGRSRADVTVSSSLDIFGGDLSYQKVVAWHKEQIMVNISLISFSGAKFELNSVFFLIKLFM